MSEAASNSISNTPSAPARAWSIISWGAFLACSWTWCIGMWLPVILLRDFGIWSFAAFAIPNVVGAAAMGVVLQRPGLSEWITSEHKFAAKAFSTVTIAFQLFFFFWLTNLGPAVEPSWKLSAMSAVFIGAVFFFGFVHRWIRHVSVVLWLISLGLLSSLLPLGLSVPEAPPPALESGEIRWLTPVMVLGFLLCPYLDQTFHRARRAVPGVAGSVSFVIGFGVLFLTMVIGTLGYGYSLLAEHAAPLPTHLPLLIAAHIVLQLVFTMAAHAQGDDSRGDDRRDLDRGLANDLAAVRNGRQLGLSIGVGIIAIAVASLVSYGGLTGMEIIYRGFMSFYGLIFPAYVWLCMLPVGTTRTARRVWTFAGAVVLASPFYWMGFIERETIWLVPGVAIVLFAKLIAGGAPRRSA